MKQLYIDQNNKPGRKTMQVFLP